MNEEAIPLTWINEHIAWLEGLDDAFSTLTAMNIRTMVNEWKEAKNSKESSLTQNALDTISRQAAIDALYEQIEQCNKSLNSFDISMEDEYAVKVERASLVAFRETLEYLPSAQPDLDEWCTDCKEYDSEKNCCPRFNRVIREALKDGWTERKKGKWIKLYRGTVVEGLHCSVCGKHGYRSDFCPNCGADMRGEQNETD